MTASEREKELNDGFTVHTTISDLTIDSSFNPPAEVPNLNFNFTNGFAGSCLQKLVQASDIMAAREKNERDQEEGAGLKD